jgi:hypothetical protein
MSETQAVSNDEIPQDLRAMLSQFITASKETREADRIQHQQDISELRSSIKVILEGCPTNSVNNLPQTPFPDESRRGEVQCSLAAQAFTRMMTMCDPKNKSFKWILCITRIKNLKSAHSKAFSTSRSKSHCYLQFIQIENSRSHTWSHTTCVHMLWQHGTHTAPRLA